MQDLENREFRKATRADQDRIWEILQQAILKRKNEGSDQWQDGYPNPKSIMTDIEKDAGYVLVSKGEIIGYAAMMINDEATYEKISGKWLSEGDFVVVHRVAVATEHLGKGWTYFVFDEVEKFARSKNIKSVKVDTNFDNFAMLKILNTLGYHYCGEVEMRGGKRKAFEKILL